ncbi:galactokinase [Candidatus Neomarinimicrobiota bacterium]
MNQTFDAIIELLYPNEDSASARLQGLLDSFQEKFSCQPEYFVSTPGRTELGGNHTDHNNGKVLAASINLDSICWIKATGNRQVKFISEGYPTPFELSLENLSKKESEAGSTLSLIRGVAARLAELGYTIGGFQACVTSDVLTGSGLSSSASIEVLIGSIFNLLYNDNIIEPEILAKTGQYAENNYFGKPCGLMDQLACAVGGIIAIDFRDTTVPMITKVPFDFSAQDYSLLIVDTGGSHADLIGDYAAVPAEMRAVARALGKTVLREVDEQSIFDNLDALRQQVGDRALLRAMHFMQENDRVDNMTSALEAGNFRLFLDLITTSGNSSFRWLQNIGAHQSTRHQGVAIALALTERFIVNHGAGAARIHGGGFAGTIQVFLPRVLCGDYRKWMSRIIPSEAIYELQIRQTGTWGMQWANCF